MNPVEGGGGQYGAEGGGFFLGGGGGGGSDGGGGGGGGFWEHGSLQGEQEPHLFPPVSGDVGTVVVSSSFLGTKPSIGIEVVVIMKITIRSFTGEFFWAVFGIFFLLLMVVGIMV